MRINELVSALHHPAWSVRVAAVQALTRLGEQAPLEQLQEAIHDEHVSVRAAAVSAIGLLGAQTSIDLLEKCLHDSEWQVREKAVLVLAMLGTQTSSKLLYAALYDPDSTVREAVVYALQQLQASTHLPVEKVPSAVPIMQEYASISNKPNNLKTFLSHLKFPFNREQGSSGATNMANISFNETHENSSIYHVRERSGGRRQHAFATGIAVLVVLALVLTWLIIVPLQHLPNTKTGNNSGAVSTATATATPSPTPISLGAAGTTLYTYQSSYRSVFSVAWSPDDKRIVATDNTIQSWDATTGKNVVTYANQMNGDVTSVTWSPDGKSIAGSGSQVQLWDAASGQSLGVYQPKTTGIPTTSNDQVYDSAWSPDSKLIASAANGQAYGFTLQVWDPQTKQCVFSIPSNPIAYIMEVRWSPDGKYLAFNNGQGIQVYDVATRTLVSQNRGGVFAWSQDSTKIVSTDNTPGGVMVWDVATGNALTSFQYQDPSHGLIGSTGIAWSPNGKDIAIVAGSITEWDINTKSKILDYPGHPLNPGNYMLSLAWSHNGSMIASSNGGEVGPGAAQVWVPATS
jgi:WD40 repeat protein